MSQFYNDSIFWIDVDKIKPNPYQPRKEFDEDQLRALSESIRQYGVLQALVVTRAEIIKDDGGIATEYELIAGERRLRASKLAGLREVPVLIRAGGENNLMKLELAIIENIQREDLNAVDRAKAFDQLVKQFNFKHIVIAEKVGKSREYVTNTLRILLLPEFILNGLSAGKITEGHTRPLLMLGDRPQEQEVLYKEIVARKLNVREAEAIARGIATDKARKKVLTRDPHIDEIEQQLTETFGTRVKIQGGQQNKGGTVTIDFFSPDDLEAILKAVTERRTAAAAAPTMNMPVQAAVPPAIISNPTPIVVDAPNEIEQVTVESAISEEQMPVISTEGEAIVVLTETQTPVSDILPISESIDPNQSVVEAPEIIAERKDDDTEDMYSIKNFSL